MLSQRRHEHHNRRRQDRDRRSIHQHELESQEKVGCNWQDGILIGWQGWRPPPYESRVAAYSAGVLPMRAVKSQLRASCGHWLVSDCSTNWPCRIRVTTNGDTDSEVPTVAPTDSPGKSHSTPVNISANSSQLGITVNDGIQQTVEGCDQDTEVLGDGFFGGAVRFQLSRDRATVLSFLRSDSFKAHFDRACIPTAFQFRQVCSQSSAARKRNPLECRGQPGLTRGW